MLLAHPARFAERRPADALRSPDRGKSVGVRRFGLSRGRGRGLVAPPAQRPDFRGGARRHEATGVDARRGRLARGRGAEDRDEVLRERLPPEGDREERHEGDEGHRPVQQALRDPADHPVEGRGLTSGGQVPASAEGAVSGARALLAGGLGSLAGIAAIMFVQRLALPLAVVLLKDEPAVASAAVLGAAALGFVRARAADRLARVVRLNLLELYLRPFEHGPVPALPSSEVVTARLATALPVLASWAADGVAMVAASCAAVPAVAALLAYALGPGFLMPLGVAGLVGAGATLAAARRVEVSWAAAWERARELLTVVSAGYDGAVDLRAHGRAGAFAERLRAGARAWSHAEGRARVHSTLFTWGAFGATIAAGAATIALSPGLAPRGDVYRSSLLVLTAVYTLQGLVAGVTNLIASRSEIDHAGRQLALARATAADDVDAPIDATAEIVLSDIGYAYPAAQSSVGAIPPNPRALDGASLVVPRGASVVITGPNGAGKTTLLHVLLGVIRPDRGQILVGGRPARLDNNPRFRERVAFLSQRPFELAEGTIRDNLCAVDPGVPDGRLLDALATVRLRDALRARVDSDAAILDLPYAALSRGQGRRVMLARALLREADLLVLDEPEAHLDAGSVAELLEILRAAARSRRVVAVVHDRALLGFADWIVHVDAPGAGGATAERAVATGAHAT